VTARPRIVTSTDIALLRSVASGRSVVAASRELGISRDRAVYRIKRLSRAFGGPVVEGERGGRSHGRSRLTALGDRVVRQGFEGLELVESRPMTPISRPNLFRGTYHRLPSPQVLVDGGPTLQVTFHAEEGERVSALLDPESIVMARRVFASSARNQVRATVEKVRRAAGSLARTVTVRIGEWRLDVAVTPESVRSLGLRPNAPVVLYVKATAVRRVSGGGGRGKRVTPGSPRP
jgi:molybdate transport system regulatory protein